jgi:beta-phosphoglucomutase
VRRPKAILFDNDGVLIASEPLHWTAWEQLLSEIGLPYNAADMRTMTGKTGPEIMIGLLNRHKPGWNPAHYDVEALALRKNDIYLASVSTMLRPYPGVRELLGWLRKVGVATAVVSNAKRREVVTSLTGLGLAPLLDALLSRDDVPAPKPDPRAYLQGALALGVDPADCLVIEDSPTGLESALLAEVPAAAVLTNFPLQALERPVPGRPDLKPAWIGSSMQDLFDWLRQLPSS